MSAKSVIRVTLLTAAVLCAAPVTPLVFAADDASVHQVYQAAEAGRYDEAQAMMDQILRDHPNSAKAHFVEAELLAKQGRMANAQTELNVAERLAPGLPFAKPAAVQNLKSLIANQPAPSRSAYAAPREAPLSAPLGAGRAGGGVSLWLLGLVLIGFIVLAVRFMSRRAGPAVYAGGYGPGAQPSYGPGPAMQPGGGTMMGPGVGGGIGSGIGSGIVGGLATGAAMGAGLVAGEALMHHFTDGNRSGGSGSAPYEPPPVSHDHALTDDNMGGSDFGLNDSSSWDDSAGGDLGGGDDWN